MFSGIIESTGKIIKISSDGSNKHFEISSDISAETHIDQSIAHNGVCLTVVATSENSHTVTAIKETLEKTNLDSWKIDDEINMERSLLATSRIDGHFVQGHVDSTAICNQIKSEDGSWYFYFLIDEAYIKLIVNKGSIAINGVSLTVVEVTGNLFSVAIIPYTYQQTNFKNIKTGDTVNLEFDILGKYIINYLEKLQPR
ncbi:MAG: riboflavin synthase [Saprospiraceae bacterium]|nr:riboflavin synthase [Saprospiraceae bacterium]